MLQRQKEMRKKDTQSKIVDEKEKEKESNTTLNNVLEDMCIYGNIIKKEIKEEKVKNPEKYIKTEEAINKKETDQNIFILGLLAKNLEDIGIETAIKKGDDKTKNNKIIDKEKDDEEDTTCLQFLTNGLIQKKKYDLHFDLGDKRNNELINNKDEFEKFKKDLF